MNNETMSNEQYMVGAVEPSATSNCASFIVHCSLFDFLGLLFFATAAVLGLLRALSESSVLIWANVLNNALLAGLYAVRRRPRDAEPDRVGMVLSLGAMGLVVVTPFPPAGAGQGGPALAIAASGQALILWSLLYLGRSFGIAPADRGLIVQGPYRVVRHPLYLGELLLRGSLAAAAPTGWGLLFLVVFTATQIARLAREERALAGYSAYRHDVRWRLIPGVF